MRMVPYGTSSGLESSPQNGQTIWPNRTQRSEREDIARVVRTRTPEGVVRLLVVAYLGLAGCARYGRRSSGPYHTTRVHKWPIGCCQQWGSPTMLHGKRPCKVVCHEQALPDILCSRSGKPMVCPPILENREVGQPATPQDHFLFADTSQENGLGRCCKSQYGEDSQQSSGDDPHMSRIGSRLRPSCWYVESEASHADQFWLIFRKCEN